MYLKGNNMGWGKNLNHKKRDNLNAYIFTKTIPSTSIDTI